MLAKKLVFGLFFIFTVLALVLSLWLGAAVRRADSSAPSPYVAVYLSTGDIYFGKYSGFPSPHLRNVWYLQSKEGENGTDLSINPFFDVFWNPSDVLYLNQEQVIWKAPLRNGSQLAKVLREYRK